MATRIRIAFVLWLLGQALLPGQAMASCGMLPPVSEAVAQNEVVFVGTVIRLENSDRWATVEVDEVWKGEIVSPEVEVRAGPKDPPGPGGVATSIDRYFKLGKQYLFFPHKGRGAVYRDNSCSATTVFKPRLETFRPVGVASPSATPEGTSEPSSDPAVPPVGDTSEKSPGIADSGLYAVAVLGLIVGGIFLRRRRATH